MSVLIKGMTMPISCIRCPFNDDETRVCFFAKEEYVSKGCPLVALPEKHGRLIDADALMDILADRLEKMPGRYGINSAVAGAVSGAMKLLDVQPAVIEAEGEE